MADSIRVSPTFKVRIDGDEVISVSERVFVEAKYWGGYKWQTRWHKSDAGCSRPLPTKYHAVVKQALEKKS